MRFIDVHSHLDMCKNISEIVKICNEKEIMILTCGVDVKSNRKALELKEKYPEMEICLGIYPLDSLKLSEKKIEEEINFIRENRKEIFGVGEVGLDFYHDKSLDNFEKQKINFDKFVKLAIELDKSLIVHSRAAEEATIEFLEKYEYKRIIMHCFSGNMKLVKRIIDNGWKLSIPASVKYNQHFQKVVEITPIENLLCETDSPFLHPDRIQGITNTPINILESYKKIAEIKKISLDEVKKAIWNNFEELR